MTQLFGTPARPERSQPAERRVPVREWTSLDHLTHDFANDPAYRQRCLELHGQYMTHDGRRVTA